MRTINNKTGILTFLMLLISLLAINSAYADTQITGPINITTPGTYYLSDNLTITSGNAIKIDSIDVIIEGNGYTIDGSNQGTTGIVVNNGYSNVVIKDIHIKNFTDNGIYLNGVSNSLIKNCYITSNKNYGIYVYYSNNNNITNNTVNSNKNLGICAYYSDDNNIVTNNASNNNQYNIYVKYSDNIKILNNTVNLASDGIYVERSDNNSIYNNTVNSNSYAGIMSFDSDDNRIFDNTVNSTSVAGIYVSNSKNNTVENNVLTSTGILVSGNSLIQYWSSQLIKDNTINGKPIYYYANANTGTVPTDAGQVIIGNCTNMNVENLNLSNIGIGLQIGHSFNNIISNITANSNRLYGINMYMSYNNTIINSTFINNDRGMYISDSYNNSLYNNIFNNTNNVFPDNSKGYWNTSKENGGGNFWFTPTGTGWSETATDDNEDGFCDSPYQMSLNNIDYLPKALDTKGPNIIINSPIKDKTYNISNILINVTTTDMSGVKEVIATINDTNHSMNKNNSYYTYNATALSDGTYTLKIYSKDNLSNVNTTETTFKVDTTAPKIITITPAKNSTIGVSTNLQVLVNEKSIINVSLSNETNTQRFNLTEDLNNENLYTKLLKDLSKGNYTLKITATDLYNNSYTNESTFTVDDTKPAIEIVKPTNNSIFNISNISLNVTADSNVTSAIANIKSDSVDKNITLIKDNNEYVGTTGILGENKYNITVYAVNTLGNTQITKPTTITIDTTKPTITNLKPVNNSTVNTGFTINATINDNLGIKNVSVKLNGTNYAMTNISGNTYSTSPITLSTGNYSYAIKAYDLAGNYKISTVNFKVDTTAPSINITTPSSKIYNISNITINATVIDSTMVDKVIANINNENITLNKAGNYYTASKTLNDGNYTLKVYANDTLGNKEVSSIKTFTVDTNKPYQVLINAPQGTIRNNDFTINVMASDNISGIKEVIANVNNENITLNKTGNYYTASKTLNDGNYLLNITAIDNANNSNSTSTTFTIDTYVPSSNSHHKTLDASDSIESSDMKRTVSESTVVYGSNFDKQLAEGLKENIYPDDYEITGDTIIVGGPVSNKIAEQYNDRFVKPVSNENPGENRGIIQILKIQDNSASVVQSYNVVYIAGSDRLGTEAALKYFETLEELPTEPIIVEWTSEGPVLV
uniref:Periplasmic copper-binding protein n=1 Tax=Methanococcus voltae (strain ATCC BAA-1334 / A3) TaxID=456320 RepID=D7DT45_METV3